MDRPRSVVWKFYELDKISKKTKCFACGKEFAYNGSTSNMVRHIRTEHPAVASTVDLPRRLPKNSQNGESLKIQLLSQTALCSSSQSQARPSTSSPIFNQISDSSSDFDSSRHYYITTALTDFLIEHLLPASIIGNSSFIRLMQAAEPRYDIPKVENIEENLKLKFEEVKCHVEKELSCLDSVSLQIELWSSTSKLWYLSVVVNGISSSWDLKTIHLVIVNLIDEIGMANMVQMLQQQIDNWNISPSFLNVVVNPGHLLGSAIERLGWTHIPCIGHTLLSALGNGLHLNEVKRLTEVCERTVNLLKDMLLGSSEQELIDGVLNDYRIVEDNAKNMCKVMETVHLLCGLQKICDLFSQRKIWENQMLMSQVTESCDWSKVSEIILVLEPLKILIDTICSKSALSVSFVYPALVNMLNNVLLKNSENSKFVLNFKITIAERLQNILSNEKICEVMQVAAVLDPRFKSLVFLEASQQEHVYKHVTELAVKHSEENLSFLCDNLSDEPPEKKQLTSVQNIIFGEAIVNACQASLPSVENDDIGTELKYYLLEPGVKITDSPLLWWKCNELRYPQLAKLARLYLSIPATSTECQNIFCKQKTSLSTQRLVLPDEFMTVLCFLHGNQKLK